MAGRSASFAILPAVGRARARTRSLPRFAMSSTMSVVSRENRRRSRGQDRERPVETPVGPATPSRDRERSGPDALWRPPRLELGALELAARVTEIPRSSVPPDAGAENREAFAVERAW